MDLKLGSCLLDTICLKNGAFQVHTSGLGVGKHPPKFKIWKRNTRPAYLKMTVLDLKKWVFTPTSTYNHHHSAQLARTEDPESISPIRALQPTLEHENQNFGLRIRIYIHIHKIVKNRGLATYDPERPNKNRLTLCILGTNDEDPASFSSKLEN